MLSQEMRLTMRKSLFFFLMGLTGIGCSMVFPGTSGCSEPADHFPEGDLFFFPLSRGEEMGLPGYPLEKNFPFLTNHPQATTADDSCEKESRDMVPAPRQLLPVLPQPVREFIEHIIRIKQAPLRGFRIAGLAEIDNWLDQAGELNTRQRLRFCRSHRILPRQETAHRPSRRGPPPA